MRSKRADLPMRANSRVDGARTVEKMRSWGACVQDNYSTGCQHHGSGIFQPLRVHLIFVQTSKSAERRVSSTFRKHGRRFGRSTEEKEHIAWGSKLIFETVESRPADELLGHCAQSGSQSIDPPKDKGIPNAAESGNSVRRMSNRPLQTMRVHDPNNNRRKTGGYMHGLRRACTLKPLA